MDYMLYECDEDRVSLKKEIDFVRNYVEIERFRYGDRLDFDMQVSGDLSSHRIAPLIFLPFLENAFKHGIGADVHKSWIKLEVRVNQGKLAMTLKNSQSGPSPNANGKNGIGLRNVKRRLVLQYGEENFTLETEQKPSEYIVNLNLSL